MAETLDTRALEPLLLDAVLREEDRMFVELLPSVIAAAEARITAELDKLRG